MDVSKRVRGSRRENIMAKEKEKKKSPKGRMGGPFLAAAFFCENILEDMQRKLSVQGINDGMELVIHPLAPKNVPSEENPLVINHQLLLMFKSGDSPGKHHLKLEIESPSGKRATVKDEEVTLSDQPNGGLNVKVAVTLGITTFPGGLYLVDVFLDGKLMTRIPFNINITRPELPTEARTKATEASPKKKS
jgi:hypothetical protein